MYSQKDLITEIISLQDVLLQKIIAFTPNIFAFEIFHKNFKKLYLIFDLDNKPYYLHIQKEKPVGIKYSCNFLQALKKNLVGNLTIFFTDNENEIVLSAKNSFSLLLTAHSPNAILFKENHFFMSYKKDLAINAPILHKNSPTESLENNLLYEKTYTSRFKKQNEQLLINQAEKNLKAQCKKKLTLIKNLQNDRAKWLSYSQKEHEAKLLKDNLYKYKKGDNGILCIDYYKNPPQEKFIPIDRAVSINHYIENIFKKSKKAKRALDNLNERISIENNELKELKQKLEHIELSNLDFSPKELVKPKEKKLVRLCYKEYLSSDSIRILVGKSAKDSDEMIKKYMVGNDWWFHAKDFAGTHVVVKYPKENLPPNTFLEAALLAAHFSKDTNQKVTVQYTKGKYIKKIKNTPFGQVIVSKEKTIVVDLNETSATLERILRTKI